jgi:hypothetical protein
VALRVYCGTPPRLWIPAINHVPILASSTRKALRCCQPIGSTTCGTKDASGAGLSALHNKLA